MFPEPENEFKRKEKLEMYELPDVIFLVEKVDQVKIREIVGTHISFLLLIRQIGDFKTMHLLSYYFGGQIF